MGPSNKQFFQINTFLLSCSGVMATRGQDDPASPALTRYRASLAAATCVAVSTTTTTTVTTSVAGGGTPSFGITSSPWMGLTTASTATSPSVMASGASGGGMGALDPTPSVLRGGRGRGAGGLGLRQLVLSPEIRISEGREGESRAPSGASDMASFFLTLMQQESARAANREQQE